MKSHWVLHNFLQKHGRDRFFQVFESLKRDESHQAIANYLGESRSAVTKFINYAFHWVPVIDPDIEHLLQIELQVMDSQKQEFERNLRMASNVFRLPSKSA